MNYRNLTELHRLQSEKLGPRPALRFKRDGLYRDLSWDEYRARSLACAAALVAAGIKPGDRIGLLSENRLEWLIADMGILAAGAVNVPLHAPLTAKQIAFQVADSGSRLLFVSTREQMEKIRDVRAAMPSVEAIVVLDHDALADGATWWSAWLLKGRQALTELGDELRRREESSSLDDLATFIYTSGTTGNPKGVMLTHGNVLTNAWATNEALPRGPNSMILCWGPLGHVLARIVDHFTCLVGGAPMALAETPDSVVQNLKEVQPTHLTCVPRLYEKFLGMVASPDPAVVSQRLRDLLGARMQCMVAGGAPVPGPVSEAYKAAGFDILQGYGLTETGGLTMNRPDACRLRTSGKPLPGVVLKIADDSEILTCGPQITPGYWNNREATDEVLRDGWFHTGDLGQLDADGYLTITGRKKELLVLSNGKKVVPSFVEGLLIAQPCIDQAVIHGEGRNFLTALIVPNWNNVRQAIQIDVPNGDEASLAGNAAVRKLLDDSIRKALKDVASWEQVKKFIVLPRPFSAAAEELTASSKIRRTVIFARYKKELDELYGVTAVE